MSEVKAPAGRDAPRAGTIVLKLFNRAYAAVYRRSGGKLGAKMGKSPILLLETVGRKSGTPRTTPLGYMPDGDRMVVVASNLGARRDPDWCLNLEARPRTTVQIGPRRLTVEAARASSDERARLWARLTEMSPYFADHQQKTARQIPVIVLRPIGPQRSVIRDSPRSAS